MPLRLGRAVAVAAAAVAFCGTWPEAAQSMSVYKWKKRPLVVFAAAGSSDLERQRAIVARDRAGFAERHMVVVYVVDDSVSADGGVRPGLSGSAIRALYGVKPGQFRAILVGKDGGAKLSSPKPLTSSRLFATIDAMPMRIDEMRRR